MNTHELVAALANVQRTIARWESQEMRYASDMGYYTGCLLEEQFLLDELSTDKSWLHAFYLTKAIGLPGTRHERQYWLDKLHGRTK
jgi:hypothetical protein